MLLLLPPALSRGSLLYNDSIPKSAIVEDLLGVIDRNHKMRSAVSEKTTSRKMGEWRNLAPHRTILSRRAFYPLRPSKKLASVLTVALEGVLP